uniref:Cystatin domain-containing protein n=1 Tax=Trichuris muris TaxID=70415 RepID=A0A5S6Q5I7_TRIMR
MIRLTILAFALFGFASGAPAAVDTASPKIDRMVKDALKDYSEKHEDTYVKLTALLEGQQSNDEYTVRLLAEPTVCSISTAKNSDDIQKCNVDRKQETLLCSGTITPKTHKQNLKCAEQVFI